MDSDYMNFMANSISDAGVKVVRFEFPYMDRRRHTGKKSPPDRMPKLIDCFNDVVQQYGGPDRCIAGGKSMGGRVASLMLAENQVAAAISLGYPFHPPGKQDKVRGDHWPQIRAPWLIVQGTRDAFGKLEEVMDYPLPHSAVLRWLEDGDHDFKPRKASGLTQPQHWQQAAEWAAEFIIGLD